MMRPMKHLVPTVLLFGYIMLVPFCFFGGTVMANTDTINMIGSPTHQMDDCGIPMAGCAHPSDAGAMGMITHHVGMYLSISQTPLVALAMVVMIASLVLFTVFGLIRWWLHVFLARHSLCPVPCTKKKFFNQLRQNFLTWLSLFETSPNFA
ncbi:MAG TPA: hypothetical protein VJJ02_02300 [Candidatus Paceibacterota bacterium]